MINRPKADIVAEIERLKVSAIIRAASRETAAGAMHAAVAGGFRLVEFTLTTPDALGLIREFAANDELLVGAGTVLSPEDAREAVVAGARFLVSPVFDPQVVAAARALDVVVIPGTFTATEMCDAHGAGADFLKLFPAPQDVSAYVASILGPLPDLKIFPTNGVTIENFTEILAAGAAGVGFVKALFDPADLASGNFAAIEDRAKEIMNRLGSL